jgi:Fe-S cluster assembly scaffold protein SufB
MSRGLAESEAKMKIVEGYFTPVLDLFKDPDLKDKVHNSITKAMG